MSPTPISILDRRRAAGGHRLRGARRPAPRPGRARPRSRLRRPRHGGPRLAPAAGGRRPTCAATCACRGRRPARPGSRHPRHRRAGAPNRPVPAARRPAGGVVATPPSACAIVLRRRPGSSARSSPACCRALDGEPVVYGFRVSGPRMATLDRLSRQSDPGLRLDLVVAPPTGPWPRAATVTFSHWLDDDTVEALATDPAAGGPFELYGPLRAVQQVRQAAYRASEAVRGAAAPGRRSRRARRRVVGPARLRDGGRGAVRHRPTMARPCRPLPSVCQRGHRTRLRRNRMDVRIGVTAHHEGDRGRAARPTPIRDEIKAQIDDALADDDKTLWLTDRHGRMSPSPSRASPTSSSAAPTRAPHRLRRRLTGAVGTIRPSDEPGRPPASTCSTAGCCSSPARAASARPPSPPRSACSRAAPGQAHAGVRGRRQGQPGRRLRDAAHSASGPARSSPGLFAHGDGHRGVAEGIPAAPAEAAAARPGRARWPARFDFVANAAPGVKEILTVGKLCWEVAARTTTTSWWSTPPPPATSSASSPPPQAINELVKVGLVRDQTGVDGRASSSNPALTGAVIVAAPEEMPVNETIELAGRLRTETSVDLAAVIVNKVLPELFGRGEEEIFERLREPEPGRARWRGRRRRRRRPCSTRRRAGGHPAPHPGRAPRPPARAELPPACRCSTCPYLFTRTHGVRATTRWPRPSARSWVTDGAQPAARAQADADATARRTLEQLLRRQGDRRSPAARAAWARRPPRRPPGAMAATHLGGKVLVLTVDPAKRLANALGLEQFGNVETRVPDELFTDAGVEPRGELWAAMLDTKQSWDDLVRTPRPRRRRPATPSWPTRSTRTSPASSSRATTTSPWSGSTRSTPRAATT